MTVTRTRHAYIKIKNILLSDNSFLKWLTGSTCKKSDQRVIVQSLAFFSMNNTLGSSSELGYEVQIANWLSHKFRWLLFPSQTAEYNGVKHAALIIIGGFNAPPYSYYFWLYYHTMEHFNIVIKKQSSSKFLNLDIDVHTAPTMNLYISHETLLHSRASFSFLLFRHSSKKECFQHSPTPPWIYRLLLSLVCLVVL